MTALVAAVLAASLLGSLHCAGMCGAFVAIAMALRPGEAAPRASVLQAAYHGGRLMTYTVLGVAAGALGAAVDAGGELAGLRRAAAVVAAASLIVFGGVLLLRSLGIRLPRTPVPRWVSGLALRGHRAASGLTPVRRALAIGLLTTLLPCGWLYAFVLAAAGTGSPVSGAVVMAAFWAGTVPVLAALGAAARAATGPLARRLPLLTSLALIGVGAYSLGDRIALIPRDRSPRRADADPATLIHAAAASPPPCCEPPRDPP